jgi:hypothetical protein
MADNTDRASFARAALKAYQKVTRTDDDDALADIIADLMHWARRTHPENPQYFLEQYQRGRTHFNEEVRAEADGLDGVI